MTVLTWNRRGRKGVMLSMSMDDRERETRPPLSGCASIINLIFCVRARACVESACNLHVSPTLTFTCYASFTRRVVQRNGVLLTLLERSPDILGNQFPQVFILAEESHKRHMKYLVLSLQRMGMSIIHLSSHLHHSLFGR